jgi:hypothetical protein
VEAAGLALPSSAELAERSGAAFQQGSRLPSPGDIAKSRGVERPGQDIGQERDIGLGRGHGRGR